MFTDALRSQTPPAQDNEEIIRIRSGALNGFLVQAIAPVLSSLLSLSYRSYYYSLLAVGCCDWI